MTKIEVQTDWHTTWHTAANPDTLLPMVGPSGPWFAQAKPPAPTTVRRLQLYGCACARMVWDLLSSDARNAVLVRERFADGRVTEADVKASALQYRWGAVTFQQHAANAATGNTSIAAARNAAKALAARAAGPAPPGGNPVSKAWQVAYNRAFSAAREYQAELVRDIFPPPGYVPALNPDWRTSTVVALARQMDETGDFSAVPILADALQDAGCDNDIMLDRCRAPSNVHCRGNWIVDLVLGRE